MAWYDDNSGGETHPIGAKKANELGLYDMSGNIREWCWDWYDSEYYEDGPRVDPRGPSSGEFRVRRGGDWNFIASHTRVANRSNYIPSSIDDYLGFQIVRPAVR